MAKKARMDELPAEDNNEQMMRAIAQMATELANGDEIGFDTDADSDEKTELVQDGASAENEDGHSQTDTDSVSGDDSLFVADGHVQYKLIQPQEESDDSPGTLTEDAVADKKQETQESVDSTAVETQALSVIPSEDTDTIEIASKKPSKKTENSLVPSEPKVMTPQEARKSALQAARQSFYQTNIRKLDRNLTPDELKEWNAIYASFRSQSVLTGTVAGVDENEFDVTNGDTGITERRRIRSLVLIDYRVKVMVPEHEVWFENQRRPGEVLSNMTGAKIEYVIIEIDREGGCAMASRTRALHKRRRHFASQRNGNNPGDIVKCNVLAVGPNRCLLECNGYDVELATRDMDYVPIPDLRPVFRPGNELDAKLLEYSAKEAKMLISVKEARPNPFIGAEHRHPIGSRRQAVICGKYRGGVFCRLLDNTICLCLYSNFSDDADFYIGDNVIVHVVHYDFDHMMIFGRIITKW